MLKVALVGTGGMVPLPERFLSSALLSCDGSMVLVDCGEGTQISLKKLKWGMKAIDVICITHFHADHIAGLPGFLSTLGNSGRTEPLTIIGPKHIELFVNHLCIIVPNLPFEMKFVEVDENENLEYVHKNYTIKTTWLDHHVTCLGFSFEVRRLPKFDKEKAIRNNVPMRIWGKLQKNDRVTFEGVTYESEMVLGSQRKGIKVSFCTDTRPTYEMVDFIKESDLFICEGMYGDNELKDKAIEKKHMVFSEAAELCKNGEVKELWLTHYSPSVGDPEEYLSNATEVFPNSYAGYDGKWQEFSFKE